MSSDAPINVTANELRHAFDRSFATVANYETARHVDVLAFRLGSDPYAFRLLQIGGLHADCEPTAVPGAVPQLLGIVGIRGLLVPVYDIAALLGYAPATRPRWLVIAQAPQPVGLAFEIYEAHLRASETSVSNEHDTDSAVRPHLRGTVRLGDEARPLIDVPSVLETIRSKYT